MMGRGRGLLQKTDLRDHAFLARKFLTSDAPITGQKVWEPGPVLDQGDTPQCTAYSAAGLLEASPVVNLSHPPPADLYKLNQQNDEWADTPHDGSSVRAAMKVLQSLGFLTQYAWDFDFTTAVQWLLAKSPVVFGTVWPDSLMVPEEGWIYLRGNVTTDSGHAYLVYGVDTEITCPNDSKGCIHIQNSWGTDFGDKGRVRMPLDHARILIHEGGECAMPTEQLLVAPCVTPTDNAHVALTQVGGIAKQLRYVLDSGESDLGILKREMIIYTDQLDQAVRSGLSLS